MSVPTTKELRTFGLSLGVVCLLWATLLWWRGKGDAASWLAGAAPVLLLLAWLRPAALRPVHRVWMPAARGLARAVTWLLLTLVFYLVFTPYGWVMRALGRDPLDRKIERGRESYWMARDDGPFDPERLEKQY